MIETIPGEHSPVALWISVAVAGTVAVVVAAYLAMTAGGDQPSSPVAAAPAPSTAAPAPSTAASATPTPAAPMTLAAPATGPAADQPTTKGQTAAAPPADCPPVFEVWFSRGSAEADGQAVAVRSVALTVWLSAHPAVSAVVDGHSDASGAEASNLQLSYQRATLVATALTASGVPTERVQARGYGEYQPIVGQPAEAAGNRRATVGVPGYEGCPLVATIGDGVTP